MGDGERVNAEAVDIGVSEISGPTFFEAALPSVLLLILA